MNAIYAKHAALSDMIPKTVEPAISAGEDATRKTGAHWSKMKSGRKKKLWKPTPYTYKDRNITWKDNNNNINNNKINKISKTNKIYKTYRINKTYNNSI